MSVLLDELDLKTNDILKSKTDVVLACLTVPTTSFHHPSFCCSGDNGVTCDDCSLDTTISCHKED